MSRQHFLDLIFSEWLRRGCAGAALALFAPVDCAQPPAAPCAGAAWHAFDFWLGEWDVVDAATGKPEAHARIEPILGGCAVHELYENIGGGKGESFSTWDDAHHVWRQFWVSGKGQIVDLEGGLENGAMVLAGAEEGTHAADMVRGIWKPENGGVRETAFRSTDNGRSWQPWFDLLFKRATPGGVSIPPKRSLDGHPFLTAVRDRGTWD
jgi:hypothetical protein